MIMSIMGRNKQHKLLLSLLLVLLELGSLPAPSSCQKAEDFVSLDEWVKKQPANAGKDVGCAKKDAALSSAEANGGVKNYIDPTTELTGEDGSYKTISESIANIPDGNTKRYVLNLKGGTVFREKVLLSRNKPFVTIKSDPQNPAIIVWNDTAATLGKDGRPLGVDGSSTMTIESDYFISYGVIFKNDAPLPKALGGNKDEEAPALRVLGSKATFYNCTIDGGQGSLYDHKGLHYFKSCTIKGTIDFIFGSAKSFYEDCNIVSKITKDQAVAVPMAKPSPLGGDFAYPIKVAPGEGGFSFKTCSINGEGDQIYLGRADWPIIYSYTQMGKEIVSLISDGGITQQAERGFYYATMKCYGPGIDTSQSSDLEYAEAIPFLGTYFVSGDTWILSLPPPEIL